jgi:hypothetical protein
VVVVVVYSPIEQSVSDAGGLGHVIRDNWISGRLFIGLGVLSTAMACQHSAFLISGTLEHKTSARWARVTNVSLLLAGGLSITLALAGYLGYLNETQGDVLNNFRPDSVGVNAGRALLGITMVLTYPMESFVARHVIVQLLFNGSMDNTGVDSSNGHVIPEQKIFFGCLGRREKWTLYIYLMALVPALLFDDIGPVLSLTGSLGASALAYIAPGLVYLGVNGEEFLHWVGQRLQHRDVLKLSRGGGGEVELPVVGDSTAEMQTLAEETLATGDIGKPWWWYPTLMPIWVTIATSGARSTKMFLDDLHEGQAEPLRGPSRDDGEVIGPSKGDFIISVLFVVFGVVAAAFGVISNVYVQVNEVFFSPH